MSTVVYLANQQVQVVTGTPGAKKISVNDCYIAEAPDGSIINGMVMDPELFVGFMKEFWAANKLPSKDVYLVINSSKFIGKNIEMPEMNPKKTDEFIEREFADVKRDDEYVYGFIPIGKEAKLKKIYAEGISPDFIKDYIDIFKEIGVKLAGIYSGESSLISMISATSGKSHNTFVMQVADKITLTTLLFVNGSFYYFNSVRCFHEMGSADYANDVARSVSQIIQFMQAHQIEYPLEAVVLGGINPNNMAVYQDALMQHGIQAPVEIFYDLNISSPKNDIQSVLHAISGLFANAKNQNFLDRYNKTAKNEKKEGGVGSLAKSIAGVLITLVVMIVLVIAAAILRHGKQKKLDEIKDYNESPDVTLEVAKYDSLLSRNSFLSAQYNAIADIDENIETYPICDSNITKIVEDCAGRYATVTFSSFDADDGSITMSAKSGTVDDINLFIKALMSEDIFENVDYTGYSFDENEQLWNIKVTCTLAESAGR